MLNITDQESFDRAIASSIDPPIRRLLLARCDQLLTDTELALPLEELVQFIVAEPGDGIAQIEAATGHPFISIPAFELVIDHGDTYEAITVLSDDGFGVVLFVPKAIGIDAQLLALLAAHV